MLSFIFWWRDGITQILVGNRLDRKTRRVNVIDTIYGREGRGWFLKCNILSDLSNLVVIEEDRGLVKSNIFNPLFESRTHPSDTSIAVREEKNLLLWANTLR
jgi:hypothetical protein